MRRKFEELQRKDGECAYDECEFKGIPHSHKGKSHVKISIERKYPKPAEANESEFERYLQSSFEETCW